MKKLLHKLRGQAGESLAETLMAVLVITLALTILAGMIGAAGNMVKTSEAKMNEYYESNVRHWRYCCNACEDYCKEYQTYIRDYRNVHRHHRTHMLDEVCQ